MQWWSEYDADGSDESSLNDTFAGGVYGTGLAALQQRFG